MHVVQACESSDGCDREAEVTLHDDDGSPAVRLCRPHFDRLERRLAAASQMVKSGVPTETALRWASRVG